MRLFSLLTLSAVLALSSLQAEAQIKNEQSVVGGALTRAGNKGQKQLDDAQLVGLCEQGYASAFFLYGGAATRTVACSRGTITYSNESINNPAPMLEAMYANIQSGAKTFVHCYNGAHASGVVAALALRQFCDTSADDAFAYWKSTMGGYALPEANVRSIGRRISNFAPNPELRLSPAQQAQLCN